MTGRRQKILAAGVVLLSLLFMPRRPAKADVVVLTNGNSLEGRVTRDGDTIVIEMAQGQVRIPRDKVRTIQPKRTPLDEFAEKKQQIQQDFTTAKISAKEAAERWFALSQWAGEQHLTRAKEEALKNALSMDPDHEGARIASGFIKHDGKWMTFTERNQALGFVFFEGQWVTPEAVQEIKKLREK